MSKKEKIAPKPDAPKTGEGPDEQIIIDLMKKRRLQQDALKKIITSMDKANDESKQDHTKLI